MLDERHRSRFGNITVVYGARNPGLLLFREELAALSNRQDLKFIMTVDTADEGWQGQVGVVPKVVERVVPGGGGAYAILCGPPMMIKYTLPVVERLGFPPEQVILLAGTQDEVRGGACADGATSAASTSARTAPSFHFGSCRHWVRNTRDGMHE